MGLRTTQFAFFGLSATADANMADLLGESSNHIDDLFKELETWEAILNALPDFDVDETSPPSDPPDLSPR